MFDLSKKGLSAHDLISFAKAENEAKKDPHTLFEKAAEVAKIRGIDSINIPGKTMAAAVKKAAREAFPGERFSATCRSGYGPELDYPSNLKSEEVEKALGRLISKEGNESDISRDFFDEESRIKVDGVVISFEAPMLIGKRELNRVSAEKGEDAITSMPTSFDQDAVALGSNDDLQAVMESNAACQKWRAPKSKQADER